jgi:hypothetical protein
MMNLPKNPTNDQLRMIVQAAVRADLEDDAIVTKVELGQGRLYCSYTTQGRAFEADYEDGAWIKGAVGATETVDMSSELAEELHFSLGEACGDCSLDFEEE